MSAKYIFVTGGVVSSLGKGITAASLGRIMKDRGLSLSMQKFDPYININPGNMSPYQHGEVFVTDDGGECDLDIGHYERFIDETLTIESDITSGGIYQAVINSERDGAYHGGTVQVIPHITNEIKKRVYRIGTGANAPDIVITEVGGTVGDIESLPFLEAIRQIKREVGPGNCLIIHVTLLPYLAKSGELKTKPTQHSVKELRSIGIQPDIIVCRSEHEVPKSLRDKISLFCNVNPDAVISNLDADTLYEIPLLLEQEGLGSLVARMLKLDCETPPDHNEWQDFLTRLLHTTRTVKVALVGKYVELRDAYLSVCEALVHAGVRHGASVEVLWVAAHELDNLDDCKEQFSEADAIIVPSGFGARGSDGKMLAAQYARENDIPFLGIGLGMQMAALEFCWNVCGLKDAESTERAHSTNTPVIDLMADIKEKHGSTMRLGKYDCQLKPGSLASKIYGTTVISERHRHRYELNNAYFGLLEQNGMVVSGVNPELNLAEIIEYPANRWHVGVQFNAEFKSRPNRPHPLFVDFLGAAIKDKE